MKKIDLVTMLMGAVGGIAFSLGMCMCTVTQWDTFGPGVITGAAGLLFLVAALAVHRRGHGKRWTAISGRAVGTVALGAAGALTLGLGMCMSMVWSGLLVPGIAVGILGIAMLLCLVPLCHSRR